MRRRILETICLAAGMMGIFAGDAALAQTPTISAPIPPAAGSNVSISQETPATLVLGDTVILRFRTDADKLSPQQRIDALEQRLSRVLAVPDLRPADVAIYASVGKAPVIYVIGRTFIKVDAATAQAAGATDALALATQWAKRLQRTLPFVDWRRPNEHEPVIAANPPLTITQDLRQVGGGIGNVLLHDSAVFTLYGVQPGGVTAAERSDALTVRLNRAVFQPVAPDVPPVFVASAPGGGANLVVHGTRILTVTTQEAQVESKPTARALAEVWAANLRRAMGVPAAGAARGTGVEGSD